MLVISIVILLILVTLNAFSQTDSVVAKTIEIGKSDNQTMNHLDILCNRFGGRVTGSDAYENAAEWAASKFREWGMEVEMDEAGELPVGFNRGPWFGRMLSHNGMNLHFQIQKEHHRCLMTHHRLPIRCWTRNDCDNLQRV